MKIGDDEYKTKEAAWIKEQYEAEERKPSGMAGNWSYRLKKEREFKAMMIQEGKVSENVQAHAKSS